MIATEKSEYAIALICFAAPTLINHHAILPEGAALWAIAVLKLTDKCLLPQLHSHSVSVKAQILQRAIAFLAGGYAIALHVVPGCVHQGSVMFVHHSFEQ